ncbi:STAS domain-containing protein [Kitasatospora sp. NPDC127111]|uniref:STAS domain-containing protein n=1 Tax=Kitasatospora sp. NPDC127111 TaxID=3345363 RepID=UPI00362971B9
MERAGAHRGGDDGLGRLLISAHRIGDVRVVAVAGELDHDTADGLRSALAAPAGGGTGRILVDLSELRFCDSTGLNLLLRARLDAEAAGLRLELAGPRSAVARLFEVTGADTVLRIHPSVEAALVAGPPTGGTASGDADPGGAVSGDAAE